MTWRTWEETTAMERTSKKLNTDNKPSLRLNEMLSAAPQCHCTEYSSYPPHCHPTFFHYLYLLWNIVPHNEVPCFPSYANIVQEAPCLHSWWKPFFVKHPVPFETLHSMLNVLHLQLLLTFHSEWGVIQLSLTTQQQGLLLRYVRLIFLKCCSCCITGSLTHLEESLYGPVLHTWAHRLARVALMDRSTAWEQGQFYSPGCCIIRFQTSNPPVMIVNPFLLYHLEGLLTHLKICTSSYIFCHRLEHRVLSLRRSTIFSMLTNCWSMLMSIRLNDRRWSFAPTKSRPFSSSSKNVW